MAKQDRFPLNPKYDSISIEGQIRKYRDPRIQYDVLTPEWNTKVKMHDDGDLWIRLEDVYQLMVENEFLRDTLFTEDSADYNIARHMMDQCAGEPTSTINNRVDKIANNTDGILSKQDIFRYMYAIFNRTIKLDFKQRNLNESKIQFVWRKGYLPVLSMVSKQLSMTFKVINQTTTKDQRKLFYKSIKKYLDKM